MCTCIAVAITVTVLMIPCYVFKAKAPLLVEHEGCSA